MDTEDRRVLVAEALRPFLAEGDTFQVICQEGEVWVHPSASSSLRLCAERYPRIYGRLLALEVELQHAGRCTNAPAVLLGAFCLGLHLHWWHGVLPDNLLVHLNSIWFFGFAFLVLFLALAKVSAVLRWRLWRGQRQALLHLLREERLDRDCLLTMIEGDDAVHQVGLHLKMDRTFEQFYG